MASATRSHSPQQHREIWHKFDPMADLWSYIENPLIARENPPLAPSSYRTYHTDLVTNLQTNKLI
jgi:hypothetical protein